MNVKSIIRQAASQSLGSNPGDDDLAIYLDYLNQAHFDLFNFTALLNPLATTVQQDVELTDGISADALDFYSIRKVYRKDNNWLLQPTMLENLTAKDPGLTKEGEPGYWFTVNQKLHCYPKQTLTLGLWAIEKPQALTLASETKDIPYTESYQHILIDGTSLLIYQNDSGMKNTTELKAVYDRWETGKRRFYSYLSASTHQEVSTLQKPYIQLTKPWYMPDL